MRGRVAGGGGGGHAPQGPRRLLVGAAEEPGGEGGVEARRGVGVRPAQVLERLRRPSAAQVEAAPLGRARGVDPHGLVEGGAGAVRVAAGLERRGAREVPWRLAAGRVRGEERQRLVGAPEADLAAGERGHERGVPRARLDLAAERLGGRGEVVGLEQGARAQGGEGRRPGRPGLERLRGEARPVERQERLGGLRQEGLGRRRVGEVARRSRGEDGQAAGLGAGGGVGGERAGEEDERRGVGLEGQTLAGQGAGQAGVAGEVGGREGRQHLDAARPRAGALVARLDLGEERRRPLARAGDVGGGDPVGLGLLRQRLDAPPGAGASRLAQRRVERREGGLRGRGVGGRRAAPGGSGEARAHAGAAEHGDQERRGEAPGAAAARPRADARAPAGEVRLEGPGEGARVGPVGRVLLQGGEGQLAEVARDVGGAVPGARRRLVDDLLEEERARARVGVLAREQLEEHDAERVDVGGRPRVGAAHLLGGHVLRRAEGHAGARELRLVVEDPRQAEVGDLRLEVLVEEDVARLEVAVHDPLVVSVRDRARHLGEDPERLAPLEPARDRLAQVAARGEGHDDVGLPVGRLAGLEHADHVRVGEALEGGRLAAEPLPVARRHVEEQLDRHELARGQAARAVDDPHAAAAELRLELPAGEVDARAEEAGEDRRRLLARRAHGLVALEDAGGRRGRDHLVGGDGGAEPRPERLVALEDAAGRRRGDHLVGGDRGAEPRPGRLGALGAGGGGRGDHLVGGDRRGEPGHAVRAQLRRGQVRLELPPRLGRERPQVDERPREAAGQPAVALRQLPRPRLGHEPAGHGQAEERVVPGVEHGSKIAGRGRGGRALRPCSGARAGPRLRCRHERRAPRAGVALVRLAPGAAVGPYVLEDLLGRGGMGAVYRARRRQDGARVALKVMTGGSEDDARRALRFQREAELAARLRHPGVVRVHDSGVAEGALYIAMDLIDGAPLAERVGRLAPREAAGLVAQVARAVEHAHAHGVVHRDLKPDNVLVRRDDGRAVVTDFGLARADDGAALTRTGALVGTPYYMAPEQVAGAPATPATDVHALGAVLYEALTGAPPFRGDALAALMVAITEQVPAPPGRVVPGVDPALDEAVLAALHKDPAARPTAGALADALEAVAEGRAHAPRRRARAPGLLAAGAAASLAVAVAAAFSARASSPAVEAAAAPPGASTTGVDAEAPAAPAAEPGWLQALGRRVDAERLVGAHDALDVGPDLDPEHRARACALLRAADARWEEPSRQDPDRRERLDRLLWLHWLLARLDPAHEVPPARRQALHRNPLWATSTGQTDAAYMVRVGRATAALAPDELTGYAFYATWVEQAPGAFEDRGLVRAGLSLALRRGEVAAWDQLASLLARQLARAAADGPAAERGAAAAELLALAREVAPAGQDAPDGAVTVLLLAAEHAPAAELAWLLERAEALSGDDPALHRQGARAALRAGRSGGPGGVWWPWGLRAAERALELDRRLGTGGGSRSAALAWDLARALGDPKRGERALLGAPNDEHPGVALRRALVLTEAGRESVPVAVAVEALERSLRNLPKGRDDKLLREALEDARAALLDLRGAHARLVRWLEPERLAALDGGP
ncbi:MAG: protein kinase [Planctomycetes bacterium]|nr:protein kinase [Planctomycetota bacterium]